MSADNLVKGKVVLNNEGVLVVLVQSRTEPTDEEVDSTKLTSDSFLFHYPHCHGEFVVKKITDEKKVLFCKGCGLRLSIPDKTKTIKDLRKYLDK